MPTFAPQLHPATDNPLAAPVPTGWGREDPSDSDVLSLVGADESLCASHDAGASLDHMTAAVAAEESRRAEHAATVTEGHGAGPLPNGESGCESLIDFVVMDDDVDAAESPHLCPQRHHAPARATSTSACYVGQHGTSASSSEVATAGSVNLSAPESRKASHFALDTEQKHVTATTRTTVAASAQVVLGRGISATVRLCEHGGRQFAVKTIRTAANDECRDAAVSETAFAKRAADVSKRHPPADERRVWEHVARVHRVTADRVAGEVTVFMEPVLGGSLRDTAVKLFASKPPHVPAAATAAQQSTLQDIARQLLQGLRALHEDLDTLHNDVKLDNVLLTDSGPVTVKLVDFGCAFVLPEGSLRAGGPTAAGMCTSQRGSLLTMAPERLRGDAYGAAADVWSAGVAVLELATGGTHPFLPHADAATADKAASGSSATFWKLAAKLKFTEGADACRTATNAAVTAALNKTPFAADAAFCDFISAALAPDAASRASVAGLLEHAWLAP